MALKYPLANGVWSTAANWNGGTVPVPGDDVRANGFTVTIDVDINVLQISTAQLLPAAAGGSFVVATNRTLTCDIIAGTTTCLTSTVGNIVNIIGNMNGSASSNTIGVSFTNSGSVLNITGNANAGTFGSFSPYGLSSAGTVNFVGNAFSGIGSSNAQLSGINITASGNLTFTGNSTANGSNSSGIICVGNSTLNGTINGGTGISAGVRLTGGTHTINSDCFGGTGGTSHGVIVSASTATFNGNIFAGNFNNSNAVQITTSTVTFNGNITGSASAAVALAVSVNDNVSNVVVSQMSFGLLGTVPVYGFVKFKNIGPTITVIKANSTTQQLVDPLTTDIPIASNVRNGIVYASGSLTGTLKVPPASSVAVGVPVDATVGTSVITITDMGTLLASYNI